MIPDTLQGKTSVKLHDVTWHQIFQVVLTPVGYTFVEDGNIIKIVSNESLTQEPVSTEIFVINYAKASDIQPTLASLVDAAAGGKIVVDAAHQQPRHHRAPLADEAHPPGDRGARPPDRPGDDRVEVRRDHEQRRQEHRRQLELAQRLQRHGDARAATGIYNYTNTYGSSTNNGVNTQRHDGGAARTTAPRPLSQRLEQHSNVEHDDQRRAVDQHLDHGHEQLDRQHVRRHGHERRSTTADQHPPAHGRRRGTRRNVLSAVFSSDQFKLVLSALQQLNNAKIVSNPTIVTLNNTEASINVGQQYPIPSYTFNQQTGTFEVSGFNYKDIGIILKVTPQVNARGLHQADARARGQPEPGNDELRRRQRRLDPDHRHPQGDRLRCRSRTDTRWASAA